MRATLAESKHLLRSHTRWFAVIAAQLTAVRLLSQAVGVRLLQHLDRLLSVHSIRTVDMCSLCLLSTATACRPCL
jgi:hypothetical protein